jgi:hypothetical protein
MSTRPSRIEHTPWFNSRDHQYSIPLGGLHEERCSQVVRLLDKGVSELLYEQVPLLRSLGRYRDSDEDSSDI